MELVKFQFIDFILFTFRTRIFVRIYITVISYTFFGLEHEAYWIGNFIGQKLKIGIFFKEKFQF